MKKYICLLVFALIVFSAGCIAVCSAMPAYAQQPSDVDKSAQPGSDKDTTSQPGDKAYASQPDDFGGTQMSTDGWKIYVRNQPLTSGYLVSNRRFYVPMTDFLKALRFGYTQAEDGTVTITSTPGKYETLNPPTDQLKCVYGKNTFTVPFLMGSAGVYVNMRRMTANLGVSFIVSAPTQTVDIVVPQGMSATDYESAAYTEKVTIQGRPLSSDAGPTSGVLDNNMSTGPASFPTATPTPAPTEQKEESPIKQIGDIGGFADTRPVASAGQCYWTVTVKNEGDQVVKNVVLTLHIQDGTGKDFDTQIKPVGNMNPGDMQKVEFYYQMMGLQIVKPKVEIKHDPLPKKEEKKPGEVPPVPKKEETPAPK